MDYELNSAERSAQGAAETLFSLLNLSNKNHTPAG